MTENYRFLKQPNIPEKKVAAAAVSNSDIRVINELNKLNIKTIITESNINLAKPVNNHTDMLCHHLGDGNIIISRGEYNFRNDLSKLGFNAIVCKNKLKSKYPDDISLNFARIGNYLVGRKDSIAEEILNYCLKNNIEIINVNQGYAKCSTCILNEKAIITSDSSIADACKKADMDVLRIRPGYIKLKGYDTGFIGGCCGLIDKNVIAFCGSIESHPDSAEIINYLNIHNIKYINLFNGDLIDIGGILPLTEYIE